MKKVSITEAKNNLSGLIDGLKSGSPVLIVDSGRPVAWLEAVTAELEGGEDGRLSRLFRQGMVRPRKAAPAPSLFSEPPPRAKPGASALDMLLQERSEGR